jgi:DNA-binding transcriptional MocR family regulator
MSRWFRLHEEILDDPKVQRLSGDDFKAWINLLCLASRHGGKLPPIEDIAFALRLQIETVSTVLERLLNGGLIVRRTGGSNGAHYAPHKWDERQYKSDTSTDRVKRFRQRSKPVSETPPDTESETDTPLSKDNGEIDPEKVMFDSGRALLANAGVSPDKAGQMLGKWKRDHGAAHVITALGKAQREGAIEPISFIEGCLKARRKDETYDRDRITV